MILLCKCLYFLTVADCGPLKGPPNTKVLSSSYSNQENITRSYKCLDGYALVSGDLNRTCQSNEEWSGEEPVCDSKILMIKLIQYAYKIGCC